MFRETIRETPFSTEGANLFFDDRVSQYTSFDGDQSMLSTVRALIEPRMPEGDCLRIVYSTYRFNKSRDSRAEVDRATFSAYTDHALIVVNYDGDTEQAFEATKAYFKEDPQWAEMASVTELFRKSFQVLCYVNPEIKTTVIYSCRMTQDRYHLLQCAIIGVFPWYYKPGEGLSDIEKRLIYSLREKSSDNYLATLSEMAEKFDFEAQRVRKLLAGIENRAERDRMYRINQEIENAREQIERYNNNIGQLLRDINERNIILMGLKMKTKEDEGESEILQYFMSNKCLYLEATSDSTIYFDVKTYVEFYDEEIVKKYLENSGSYIYDHVSSNGMTRENVAKLVRAIFIDQTIRMKFCAAYYFDLKGNVVALDHHDFPAAFNDYFRNTHIQEYSCMGDYKRNINMLLMNNDYIGAFEQCIASCKSLNFADGAVMEKFFKAFCDSYKKTKKYYELPDGTSVSCKEALEWLDAQEAANNTESAE